MKRLLLIEFDTDIQWKPGRFRSRVGGRPYRRYWWLFFGLTIWTGDAKEYGEAIKGCEWRE